MITITLALLEAIEFSQNIAVSQALFKIYIPCFVVIKLKRSL